MNRRNFLFAIVSAFTGTATAQKAILEKGESVICESDPVKCPNGHATCRRINAPLVVGNDNRDYPNWGQLYDFHLMRCDVCHVLFTRE